MASSKYGVKIYKHPRSGMPQRRVMFLTSDGSALGFCKGSVAKKKKVKKLIPLSTITGVREGRHGEVFERTTADYVKELKKGQDKTAANAALAQFSTWCFSLLTATRSVDIECESSAQAKELLQTFNYLLSSSGRVLKLGNLSHTVTEEQVRGLFGPGVRFTCAVVCGIRIEQDETTPLFLCMCVCVGVSLRL